ncbi:MAG: phosphate transport system regulatory protein PhoU, partial [Negativicutes bacterium]|nr:phosphate transport system regulatory protein PhoU [Negativicutes bacterium]
YMMEDPRTIGQATQLIFAGRYLERIADHATNIAEWTIYLVTGERRRKK